MKNRVEDFSGVGYIAAHVMIRLFFALAALGATALAQLAPPAANSALGALQLLPKDAARNLARIEAREGTPVPERWHVLVHDPAAENGLREYVIAAAELIASKPISQFADKLKAEDVIGVETVKIDSDRAAKIAQHYAAANKSTIAAMNFELSKDGADAVPLWRVVCLDKNGNPFGEVVITATKGNVVAHDGFMREPDAKTLAKAETLVKTVRKPKAELVAEPPRRVVRGEELPPDETRPSTVRRIGGSLQRIFTGRNTISE